MSWEISHSVEAWKAFLRGLEAQSKEWLAEACATCTADAAEKTDNEAESEAFDNDEEFESDFDWQYMYKRELADLMQFEHDTLVDLAYRWCEENHTCSNGGFDFYVDEGGYYSICLADYENKTA